MKLWQIFLAVGLGVAYGLFAPDRLAHTLGDATLYVFLPALLFEAAWNLNAKTVRRNWVAIGVLAGPGVLLTAAIVAGALAVVRAPFGPALLTGAILSATDPIAVVAVFRRLKVPKTLATIVECESLFNDAVAVALYRAVLAAIALAAPSGAGIAGVIVGTVAGSAGGVVLGIAFAFVVARVLRGVGSVRVQIAATVLCAYGAYFAADYLKMSGIFATIASGMALRYFERSWITLTIAEGVDRFWAVVAFAANALVFFLVGAALRIGRLGAEPEFAVACIAGVAIARVAVSAFLLPGPYPREWIAVVRVAGMRGALSLALALAIPATLPYREAIVDGTFAVALATLIAGSLSLVPVVRRAAGRRTKLTQIPTG